MANLLKIIEKPENNTYRFVPEYNPFQGYQTLYTDWYFNQLQIWDIKKNYFQKSTFWDYIGVQIFVGGQYANKNAFHRLQVLDCKGKVIKEINPTEYSYLTGNSLTLEGSTFNLFTINWKTNFVALGIGNEGTYYLRLKLAYAESPLTPINEIEYDYEISEPISVKNEHPGTRLLEYISYSNKLDTQFTDPTMYFHLRVEGDIIDDRPKVLMNQYTDQKVNLRQPKAIPYNGLILKMGYPRGVPMWLLNKVNVAFCNDLVICDKVRYRRDESADIEITTKVERYKQYGAQLKLRYYDNRDKTRTISKAPLKLISVASFPICVFKGQMRNGTSNATVNFFNGYELQNDSQVPGFVSALNSWSVTNFNLGGYFARQGDWIVYINGQNENFNTNDSVVFSKLVTVRLDKSAGWPFMQATNIGFEATRAAIVYRNNYEVYVSPDGGITNYSQFYMNYLFPNTDTVAYVRIYHDNYVRELNLSGNSTAVVTQITWNSVPPTSLEKYIHFYSFHSLSGFNIDISNLPATLKEIYIQESGFLNTITGFDSSFPNLSVIDLRYNFLSVAGLDAVCNDFYNGNNASMQSNGRINLRNQYSSQAVSAASLTARNFLTITKTWQGYF